MSFGMNTRYKPVRIIEVIGPAGAGKSTLGQNLSQTNRVQWVRSAPYFRKLENFPFFAANSFLMLRTLLHFYVHKNGRWFTPEEITWMVILNGWSNKLRHDAETRGTIIFLDEGPIFHLAYLFMRGPRLLQSSYAQDWWQKMCWQVANTTDVVVWLDASNEVLLRRIRTRKKSHLFNSATDNQVFNFVDKLRKSYSRLVPNFITQKGGLKVLMFDTEKEHIDRVSEQILAAVKDNSTL